MDFEFAQPGLISLLGVVAALFVIAALRERGRRRARSRFADAALTARVAPSASAVRPFARALLIMGAIAATVLALMDPRWGMRVEEIPRSGLDCFFVVDVSRSMLAGDATPSRLDRAKLFVSDALERVAGDRVGLIEFAGAPAIRVPLTLNYGAFRMTLGELSPQSATRGGTELAGAIRLAVESFPESAGAGRAIVILSDGEDMGGEDDDPIEAARAAQAAGVRVYSVVLGDAHEGARIPVVRGGNQTWLVHDGQEVWSRANPELLRRVAESGGGTFVPAGTAQLDMGDVYEQTVGQLERVEGEAATVKRSTPRFQWFAGVALGLVVAESLITDRRSRRRREERP